MCVSKATLSVYCHADHKTGITIVISMTGSGLFYSRGGKMLQRGGHSIQDVNNDLDNAPGHPSHRDDFHSNVKIMFLPPNMTSFLQLMNGGGGHC